MGRRSIDVAALRSELAHVPPVTTRGRIIEVRGPLVRASLSGAAIGDVVIIRSPSSTNRPSKDLTAQVVGFSDQVSLLTPFGPTNGLMPGAEVDVQRGGLRLNLGSHILGCVVDSLGRPLERLSPPAQIPLKLEKRSLPLHNKPPKALARRSIDRIFRTGIRAVDGFVTLGFGQRLCIFAEPGVGKSTLLGSIAAGSAADINVIALIGERGREVNELLEDTLDRETLSRSVVVVSTSDEPAICREAAADVAVTIAEYFRDSGLDVLLLVDSLTRLLRAQREVGLAAGEVPVRRGYPPSVFAKIPGLIERAGTSASASITAIYTMLLSSELDEDPMVEEVKGLTDGHLMLSRELAEAGQYPAVDIISSISRLSSKLLDDELKAAVRRLRRLAARLKRDRDLMLLGGAKDAELDAALRIEPELRAFLSQAPREHTMFDVLRAKLVALSEKSIAES